jgi:hypothetical protein
MPWRAVPKTSSGRWSEALTARSAADHLPEPAAAEMIEDVVDLNAETFESATVHVGVHQFRERLEGPPSGVTTIITSQRFLDP